MDKEALIAHYENRIRYLNSEINNNSIDIDERQEEVRELLSVYQEAKKRLDLLSSEDEKLREERLIIIDTLDQLKGK